MWYANTECPPDVNPIAWVGVSVLFFFAASLFAAAHHPEWDLRWRSNGNFEDKAPMSAWGRRAGGFFVLYLGIGALIVHYFNSNALGAFAVGAVIVLICVGRVAKQDRQMLGTPQRALNVSDAIASYLLLGFVVPLYLYVLYVILGSISRGEMRFNGELLRQADDPAEFWAVIVAEMIVVIAVIAFAFYIVFRQLGRRRRG